MIPWERHESWYEECLNDPSRILLIAEVLGEPVAVLRFDVGESGEAAEISIYLASNAHGHGVGAPVLRAAVALLERERPAVRRIHAHVRADNAASASAFLNAGFKQSEMLFTIGMQKHASSVTR